MTKGDIAFIIAIFLSFACSALVAVTCFRFFHAYKFRKRVPVIFGGRLEVVIIFICGLSAIVAGVYLFSLSSLSRDISVLSLALGINALGLIIFFAGIAQRGTFRIINVDIASFLATLPDFFGGLGIPSILADKQKRIVRELRVAIPSLPSTVKLLLNPRGTVVISPGWRAKRVIFQLVRSGAGQALGRLRVSQHRKYALFLLIAGILYLVLTLLFFLSPIFLMAHFIHLYF